MRLSVALSVIALAAACTCFLAASFVPWQTGSILAVEVSPGLWTIEYDGFGGSEKETYRESDSVDDDARARIAVIQAVYILGLVSGIAAIILELAVFPWRFSPAWFSGAAAVLSATAVILFEVGVQNISDNSGDFFDWTHGMNLAVAAASLFAAALAIRFLVPKNLRLVAAGSDPEGRP